VHVANAIAYGQTDETPPLHEAVSWRLAVALGPPWDEIVVPCVLREYASEDGSLSLRAIGWPRDTAPTLNPTWCLPAAFFDSLIAQQDRHDGNWRWDGNQLTLIDHGYTFALPRAILNYSDFVAARHGRGAASLLTEEHDGLDRLLSDSDLLGMARFLLPDTRQTLGLTQAEVAERLGVSPSYLSAVEAGRRNLTLGQLANIANAMRLGIDISFIRPDGTPVRVDQA
jgi:DNA-binding XRE family transcriptional regulator